MSILDAKTAPDVESTAQELSPERSRPSAIGWTLLLFLALWAMFHELTQALPYVRNGSDVVFRAKLNLEEHGRIYPLDPAVKRVLIFGNSKVLAGFLPSLFDQLGAEDHRNISSFNSGFPGSDLYLQPLKDLCAHGQAPQVLLLTLPWSGDAPRRGVFHFILDDHAVIEDIFPFRNLVRDLSAFLLNAPSHGGVIGYYGEAREAERAVVAERGYHLITEQSRFPEGRLPDNFHVASDTPTRIVPRFAPMPSAQVRELDQLTRRYHIDCFYIPFYLREGEAAPAAATNERFAAQIAHNTPCRLLGPDYYLYPSRFFTDQTHLNREGARVYTAALYQLLKDNTHALQ